MIVLLSTRKSRYCWIKLLFLFSLHTKSISELVSWVAVYAGSESSRISSFVFWRWTKVLRFWNIIRWVINDRIFIFWVSHPFKKERPLYVFIFSYNTDRNRDIVNATKMYYIILNILKCNIWINNWLEKMIKIPCKCLFCIKLELYSILLSTNY